jgi:hypothetical protein
VIAANHTGERLYRFDQYVLVAIDDETAGQIPKLDMALLEKLKITVGTTIIRSDGQCAGSGNDDRIVECNRAVSIQRQALRTRPRKRRIDLNVRVYVRGLIVVPPLASMDARSVTFSTAFGAVVVQTPLEQDMFAVGLVETSTAACAVAIAANSMKATIVEIFCCTAMPLRLPIRQTLTISDIPQLRSDASGNTENYYVLRFDNQGTGAANISMVFA